MSLFGDRKNTCGHVKELEDIWDHLSGLERRIDTAISDTRDAFKRIDDRESDLGSARSRIESAERVSERALENSTRLSLLEDRVDQLRKAWSDDVDRLQASITNIRGLATGGRRNTRKLSDEDQAALEAGQHLLAAMVDAQRGDAGALTQIIEQLRQASGATPDDGGMAPQFRFED